MEEKAQTVLMDREIFSGLAYEVTGVKCRDCDKSHSNCRWHDVLHECLFPSAEQKPNCPYAYISDEKKEYYKSSGEMYFPVQPYTGEICFDKKRVLITPVPAKGNLCLDITGIKKDLFAKNKIYVKLELYFTSDLIQPPRKPMIVEQWVPVE